MLTYCFSKSFNYIARKQIIALKPAETNVEKIVSLFTIFMVYPILLKMDALLIGSLPIITGFVVESCYPTGKAGAPIVFGVLASSLIIGSANIAILPAVIIWCFFSYKNNKLRIIDL